MLLYEMTAKDIHDRFVNRKLAAVDIVSYFLKRIDALNEDIGAFLSVFHERALDKARRLDEKLARGEKVGVLAAIPIAVKDNIHVKGEISTCGSKFLTNYRAPFDSTAVRLLEEQDAIIIGKTNLDEFAMGSSTENSALQQTRNPWNLSCVPGGSSGGSAAAVAARMCPVALGSDTGGSVRQPASLCGIVGFKPTYGRVSRYGLVAYGSSLDQIGVLAMNTGDAALIMSVIGQHCEKDSTSMSLPSENYASKLEEPLHATRVGVPWQFLESLDAEPKRLFNEAIDSLKMRGMEIIDVDLSILKYSLPVYYILATAEASTNLARFDGIRYGVRSPRAKTLDEVYDFSKEEGFGKEVKRRILMGTFVLSAGYQDAYYKKAQKVRTLIIRSYEEAFKKCDVVATPVSPCPAFPIGSKKTPIENYLDDIYTLAINLVGLPGISVPAAFTSEQLPFGLQIIGPQKEELRVLQFADCFERLAKANIEIPPCAKKEM